MPCPLRLYPLWLLTLGSVKDIWVPSENRGRASSRWSLHDSSPRVDTYPFEELAVSSFLREVVTKQHLRNLRFLALFFPAYAVEIWPKGTHAAILDWHSTISDAMKNGLGVRKLTILVKMEETPTSRREPASRKYLTYDEARLISLAYADILAPLEQLGRAGLRRFGADLAWPYTWTNETRLNMEHSILATGGNPRHCQRLIIERAKHEAEMLSIGAEEAVMGERYINWR